MATVTILMEVLVDPARLGLQSPGDQTRLVRQARQAGLLGFLAARIDPEHVGGKLADHLFPVTPYRA